MEEQMQTHTPVGARLSCAGLTLERALFALAGSMTLVSVGLSLAVTPWFLVLAAFVALSQWTFVLVGDCPASLVLRRVPCLSGEGPR
jgi:hypothetical protein